MTPEEVGRAYNTITHLWSDEKFRFSNGIEAHKRALSYAKVDAVESQYALDVGCGRTGRFIDLLLADGFHVQGVDVSSEMLRLAKQKHPDVSFHHADICQWVLPKQYDFITAWDSIWHVPLVEQEKLLRKLVGGLATHGILIFSFGGVKDKGEHTDNFMGPKMYYSSLGVNGFLAVFSRLNCLCRHLEFDQYPSDHAYIIIEKLP